MEPGLFQYLNSFLTDERKAAFERVLAARTRFLTVVLEDLHHQHNASACLRSCDCFGVQDMHIIEQSNEFRPNAEIALGATNWTTISRYRYMADPVETCVSDLRSAGYRIIGTSPSVEHSSIEELPLDQKTALVFGNESRGLTGQMCDLADDCVRIPMVGFTESFNISVAVAVALYELTGRLRRERDDWQLTEGEKDVLRIEWLEKTLGWKLKPYVQRYYEDLAKKEHA